MPRQADDGTSGPEEVRHPIPGETKRAGHLGYEALDEEEGYTRVTVTACHHFASVSIRDAEFEAVDKELLVSALRARIDEAVERALLYGALAWPNWKDGKYTPL